MRERIAQHRANPACASCHAMMDPLGLSLENFDFVGRWRTVDEALIPIDASVVLPDGTTFAGPAGLRNVLVSHPDRFVRTFTEKLLTYALGRGLEYLRHAGGARRSRATRRETITARRRSCWASSTVFPFRMRKVGLGSRLDQGPSRPKPEPDRSSHDHHRMALPRRTVLRGLGATIALPVLDAMVPAFAAAAQTAARAKCRMGFVYVPNGVAMNDSHQLLDAERDRCGFHVFPNPDAVRAVPRSPDDRQRPRAEAG